LVDSRKRSLQDAHSDGSCDKRDADGDKVTVTYVWNIGGSDSTLDLSKTAVKVDDEITVPLL
jgi:hypothetical protein